MKFGYFFTSLILIIAFPLYHIVAAIFSADVLWSLDNLAHNFSQGFGLFNLVTHTADGVYAIISSAILMLILVFFYRGNWKLAASIAIYCTLLVGGTQVIKSVTKSIVQEPRPFIQKVALNIIDNSAASDDSASRGNAINQKEFFNNLAKEYLASAQHQAALKAKVKNEPSLECTSCTANADSITDLYYSMNKYQKDFFINYYIQKQGLSESEAKNLRLLSEERGYSLPSGHAMFAATWLFIYVFFAFNARKPTLWLVTLGVVAYCITMQMSRVYLGYHYAHDVLFSGLIAWVVGSLTVWLVFVFYKILNLVVPNRRSFKA